jgi:hypothetical protein
MLTLCKLKDGCATERAQRANVYSFEDVQRRPLAFCGGSDLTVQKHRVSRQMCSCMDPLLTGARSMDQRYTVIVLRCSCTSDESSVCLNECVGMRSRLYSF